MPHNSLMFWLCSVSCRFPDWFSAGRPAFLIEGFCTFPHSFQTYRADTLKQKYFVRLSSQFTIHRPHIRFIQFESYWVGYDTKIRWYIAKNFSKVLGCREECEIQVLVGLQQLEPSTVCQSVSGRISLVVGRSGIFHM